MEKFTYKQGFITQEIDVSKEMIVYKGKNIPGNFINGIGISFINLKKVIIGQAIGGAIGNLIAQKGFNSDDTPNKDSAMMPPEAYGQVIITYNSDGQKQKVARIPINTKLEECKRLISLLIKTFPDKFVGFGNQLTVEKALNISHRGAIAFAIILIVGIAAYALTPLLLERV